MRKTGNNLSKFICGTKGHCVRVVKAIYGVLMCSEIPIVVITLNYTYDNIYKVGWVRWPWGWKCCWDILVAHSTFSSCRGFEISNIPPLQAVHNTCTFSSQELDNLFLSLQASPHMPCSSIHLGTHRYTLTNITLILQYITTAANNTKLSKLNNLCAVPWSHRQ